MQNFFSKLFVLVVIICGSSRLDASMSTADLVLKNGIIISYSAEHSFEALAIKDKKIIFLGSEKEVRQLIGSSTKLIDLKGQLVIPGFVESHGHLMGLGFSKLKLNLVDTKSEEDVLQLVKKELQQLSPGDWLRGRGWDQNLWPITEFPNNRKLSAVVPDNPVFLTRIDGHAAWVNKRALKIARIDRNTDDPRGGKIIRDQRGEPTGILIDNAMDLVSSKIPQPSREQMRRALTFAVIEALKNGVTSFHDAGMDRVSIELLKESYKEKRNPLRLYVMLNGEDKKLIEDYFDSGPKLGLFENHLTIRSVKLLADGALGSRGAALLEPYSDKPDETGLMLYDERELYSMAVAGLHNGFQLAVHAIGDRTNRVVLNVYEKIFSKSGAKDARFRIEHAQVIHPQDLLRFAELGVIASMQPIHATSDMGWVESRLGKERTKNRSYMWQNLIKLKVVVASGSDVPVESIAPLLGFYAAITRQDKAGKPEGGWYPEQRMTRLQALKSFTINGAFAAFQENELGSIAVSKLADLVVLSKDIMTIAQKDILSTEVVMTIIDGRVVYQKP